MSVVIRSYIKRAIIIELLNQQEEMLGLIGDNLATKGKAFTSDELEDAYLAVVCGEANV